MTDLTDLQQELRRLAVQRDAVILDGRALVLQHRHPHFDGASAETASHRLVNGKIEAMPRDWKGKLREFQNRPMLKNSNFALTQVLFTLFQPKRAWVEFWKNREMLKVMQSSQESASK